jgi:hypothetical protein
MVFFKHLIWLIKFEEPRKEEYSGNRIIQTKQDRNVIGLYITINIFENGYPHRVNLVKENEDILNADFDSISVGERIYPVTFILNIVLC